MTTWNGVNLLSAPPQRPIAMGGAPDPSTVLAAVASGLFVMPADEPDVLELRRTLYEDDVAAGAIHALPTTGDLYEVSWWCPDPRFVIPVGQEHVNRKIRSRVRRSGWTTTVNRSFAEVVRRCRGNRRPRWITDALVETLLELHRLGWVYSAEVWSDGDLIAGAFGFAMAPTLSIDSLFSERPDVSKLVMVDVVRRAAPLGVATVDLQWPVRHGEVIGGRAVPRAEFLEILSRVSPRQITLPEDRRDTSWLFAP